MDESWIETLLDRLEFVEWDRWYHANESAIKVFGWIDRDGEYKDFVVMFLDWEEKFIDYTTSSAEYSEKIADLLPGEINHGSCHRVENHLDVENVVELEEGSA